MLKIFFAVATMLLYVSYYEHLVLAQERTTQTADLVKPDFFINKPPPLKLSFKLGLPGTERWDSTTVGPLTLEVRQQAVGDLHLYRQSYKVRALINLPTPDFLRKLGVTQVSIVPASSRLPRSFRLPDFRSRHGEVGAGIRFTWGQEKRSGYNADGKQGTFIKEATKKKNSP
jgi:hypothetical protein